MHLRRLEEPALEPREMQAPRPRGALEERLPADAADVRLAVLVDPRRLQEGALVRQRVLVEHARAELADLDVQPGAPAALERVPRALPRAAVLADAHHRPAAHAHAAAVRHLHAAAALLAAPLQERLEEVPRHLAEVRHRDAVRKQRRPVRAGPAGEELDRRVREDSAEVGGGRVERRADTRERILARADEHVEQRALPDEDGDAGRGAGALPRHARDDLP